VVQKADAVAAPPRRSCRMALAAGDYITVMDRGEAWLCRVLGTKPGKVKVHYEGWRATYDCWIAVGKAAPPAEGKRMEVKRKRAREVKAAEVEALRAKQAAASSARVYVPSFGGEGGGVAAMAATFDAQGLCHLRRGITAAVAGKASEAVESWANHVINVVNTLGLQQELTDKGFTEFKFRHTGRYDMQVPAFREDAALRTLVGSSAPWLALVQAVMGADAKLLHSGVMLSMPGSHIQPWHQDGPHLDTRRHQPCHALNVFVPLVDLSEHNGGTEMVPGTHVLGNSGFDDEPGHLNEPVVKPLVVLAKSGEALVFDYRLKHRGLANNSSAPRPVMCVHTNAAAPLCCRCLLPVAAAAAADAAPPPLPKVLHVRAADEEGAGGLERQLLKGPLPRPAAADEEGERALEGRPGGQEGQVKRVVNVNGWEGKAGLHTLPSCSPHI